MSSGFSLEANNTSLTLLYRGRESIQNDKESSSTQPSDFPVSMDNLLSQWRSRCSTKEGGSMGLDDAFENACAEKLEKVEIDCSPDSEQQEETTG
mmetsp:Transcript_16525/g.45538  ORF Transcript_16525/g.45538 Transcript_16525/m.45538 type:complete len:95 (+) Transcript_16525:3130-3414(+)